MERQGGDDAGNEAADDRAAESAEPELKPSEAVLEAVESLVDLVESLVDLVESLVDLLEALVNSREALVNSLEGLVNSLEAFPRLDTELAQIAVDSPEGFVQALVGPSFPWHHDHAGNHTKPAVYSDAQKGNFLRRLPRKSETSRRSAARSPRI
jgi:hypothetical protein